jgi:hypothetical protein
MPQIELALVRNYIESRIGPEFHEKKLEKLRALTVETILKRKNPYLFRAKGAVTANDLVESVLDATVSSGEETVFGGFLERLAIFVCEFTHQGKKSSAVGLDLEFEVDARYYVVTIKSGPNWANADQRRKMESNFKKVKQTLRTSGGLAGKEIIAIEACCYGSDEMPDKGDYLKLCGQRFWTLISGREDLFTEIISPLGTRATERSDELKILRATKLNLFTQAFLAEYCTDGVIDWEKLVRYNSGIRNA